MNMKIRYKNVEVQLDVEFDEDGEGTVKFYNPNNGQLVEHVSQIPSGWSFQDPEDNKSMEVITEYLHSVDWDLWLQDVEDDDIYEINVIPDSANPDIEIIHVERVDE